MQAGKLDVDGDLRDGAVFEAEFFRKDASASNVVAISTDNGISWKTVWENNTIGQRNVHPDLTNHVEGTYGCLIRVTLRGDRMAIEFRADCKECGVPFTIRFADSRDLKTWRLTSSDHIFTKDRYSSCPTIRFLDGMYYMIYDSSHITDIADENLFSKVVGRWEIGVLFQIGINLCIVVNLLIQPGNVMPVVFFVFLVAFPMVF